MLIRTIKRARPSSPKMAISNPHLRRAFLEHLAQYRALHRALAAMKAAFGAIGISQPDRRMN
jgi:hypothetical protein